MKKWDELTEKEQLALQNMFMAIVQLCEALFKDLTEEIILPFFELLESVDEEWE